MSAPVLAFQIGSGEEIVFPLDAAESTLGRLQENSIVIENSWISARHARFTRGDDGAVTVFDLGSHNGIEVNGERISERRLDHQDTLRFGQVDAVFRDESRAQASKSKVPVAIREATKGVGVPVPRPAGASHAAQPRKPAPAQSGKPAPAAAAPSQANPPTADARMLADAQKEVARLKSEHASAVKELAAAKSEVSELKATLDQTKREAAAAAEAETEAGKAALATVHAKVATAEKELGSIKQQSARAREEATVLEAEVDAKRKAIEELEREQSRVESTVEASTRKQDALASELGELEGVLGESTRERDIMVDELAGLGAKRSATEEQIGALLASASEVREQASLARDHLQDLTRTIAELEIRQATLEDACHELASKRDTLADLAAGGGAPPPAAQLDGVLQEKRREIDEAEATRELRLAEIAKAIETFDELKAKIAELRGQRELLDAAPDLNWGTVHVFSKLLIKKIDLLDDLIASHRDRQDHHGLVSQLEVFKVSLLDILRDHSVEPFGFDPGTELDIRTRKRILITANGKNGNPAGNPKPGNKVLATLRPGYLCSNGSKGAETLLRKAEVQTA